MVCAGYTTIWDLASGELVRLDGARGTTLRVTRGTLWLTQEHDTRDIVLKAGDVFTIDRPGLTLAQAHGSASVCVLSHYVDAVRVPPDRRPIGRGCATSWNRPFRSETLAGGCRTCKGMTCRMEPAPRATDSRRHAALNPWRTLFRPR